MAAISAANPPPVAVLPNGKTNLIALDLGADGDPIAALERVLELARTDMVPHIVSRELISLSRQRRRQAGARHVPGRRGPCRHDALLPPQNQPVDPRVAPWRRRSRREYPGAARAVLFYGSCLRERQLDGLMLDFYLIVSSYRAAYGKSWLAAANRLIPPNVFPFEHEGLAAKYAVLSEADFHRLNGPETLSVSVWARFAQPSRLVWSADEQAARACVAAVARRRRPLLAAARPMLRRRARRSARAVARASR
jgi:hypothetical protein